MATAMSHSGSTKAAVSNELIKVDLNRRRHTDQGFLAQILGLGIVLFPLEESKRLVDEWQNIHAYRSLLFLHLDGGLKLSDCIVELLLVKQEFSIIVVDIGHSLKVFDDATECSHGRCNGSELVLRYAELNV